ncbi:hypothetical protein FMUND_4244 [Fusarium mundagurra]|uniref:Uncharacterized protein n=1 Tax=Fusarium mundagurra TaxID=1567541 RepID=A0A8H5YZZ1_9HYPO|nr:hypothetical protein FMUND_4244 [Fusarium mundagurra]
MNSLSTEEIVTILSTIPGLLISCLSAWFAYLALQRRHVPRNDIETATIEFIITHISAARLSIEMQSFHETSNEILLLSENLPQLPPTVHRNITGEGYRRIEVRPPARVDLQNNLLRPGPVAA